MEPVSLFKSLADETRLRLLLLIAKEQELCVCELTEALDENQPKVSRHLAQLRKVGLLQDRRQGVWIYYRISDALPAWVQEVIERTLGANQRVIKADLKRLAAMGDRPERLASCC
ncbi:metalloregulator ArsR/SmtB family transcription factor [Maricurvus nonylphenolicus]|uniref:metalloregulator ArsR/SmtB family transcription factor n=1 Tax=Maricurvus nonylphenolicus TaxID=1008307 RepID=UPI0036F31146